jgi:hypothetical protein
METQGRHQQMRGVKKELHWTQERTVDSFLKLIAESSCLLKGEVTLEQIVLYSSYSMYSGSVIIFPKPSSQMWISSALSCNPHLISSH